MLIEKTHYDIVSKGEDQPEEMPVQGQECRLLLVERGTTEARIGDISVSYVEQHGPYAHIMGRLHVETGDVSCRGNYLVEGVYPENRVIGDLSSRDIIEEDLIEDI